MYLWCRECCCAAHGVLHMGRLNIQSFKLVLKFVHECGNLKKKQTDSDYETLKNNNLLELLKRWNSTFSRFILFRVMSMPFTTPDIDFVTWEIKHHHEHADQNENKQVVAGFLGWQQHDPVINVPGSSLLQFGPLLPQHLPERSSWGGSRTGSSVWWHSLHGSSPLPCSPSGWPKDTQK